VAYHSAVDASWHRDQAQNEIGRLGSWLDAFDDAAGRRLRADLMLLFDPATASRIDGVESMQREARQLVPIASQVSNLHASILELRNQNATLVALLGHLGGNERNEALVREILDLAKRVRYPLSELRSAFERVDYPFDHAAGQLSVAQYLVKIIPPEDEVGSIYEAADEAINKLLEMYARAIGRLCVIAEAVEAVQGYEPLPSAAPATGA
jgi:hypothetical protein